MKQKQCIQSDQKLAVISLSSNIFSAVLKFIVGILSGSMGFIAGSLNSLVNTVTSIIIILNLKIHDKKSNSEYHYGYGKIEFIVSGFIMLSILIFAAFWFFDAISYLFIKKTTTPPHIGALFMAILSIAGNEILSKYMQSGGLQMNKQKMISHNIGIRIDSVLSIVIALGVLGSQAGLLFLDPLAAIIVVIVIFKITIESLIVSVKGLMDYSANDIYAKKIKSLAFGTEGVLSIHDLKTRYIGEKLWIDIDICVEAKQTIKDANMIANMVKKNLFEEIKNLERVMVNCLPQPESNI
ncbi:MAG: cation transporter [Desulfobacterales bacterium]|nr:cation transporter [Desulfobacterales bacterium]